MKKLVKGIITAAVWLVIWQVLATSLNSQILFPSPLAVLGALAQLAKEASFYKSAAFSVLRMICGFVCGTAAGTLLALLTFKSKILRSFFAPVVSVIKSTPVASFIVLLFYWLTDGTAVSFTAALIVIPVIHGSLFAALGSVDEKLLQMAKVFEVKPDKVLKNIYIPSVMPQFKASLATAMGLCWKAGIAAEVICRPEFSLGSGIYDAKIYFNSPDLFAWTAVVIAISVILEKTVVRLLKRSKEVPQNEA